MKTIEDFLYLMLALIPTIFLLSIIWMFVKYHLKDKE
jgi:hypothetical protein